MTYTAVCTKDTCYWRATTDNAAQAALLGTEHEDLHANTEGHTDHRVSFNG